MADVTVNQKQLAKLEIGLRLAGKSYESGKVRLLKKIGVVVQGLARRNAPESLTKSMYVGTLKGGVTKRKASSFTSGSLRKSITTEVGKDFVSIFVPSNSPAGEYAEKMEDEKGKTWNEVGKRTKQKGSQAGDKYIERAGKKAEPEIDKLIDQTLNEMIKGI